MRNYVFFPVMLWALLSPARAEDYIITLKDKEFSPQALVIPANRKVKVIVKNQDAAPMEFESHELKREKVIKGNSEAILYIGPVAAGSYPYFNEFHPQATGIITAK